MRNPYNVILQSGIKAAALVVVSFYLVLLVPSAHGQGGVPLWTNLFPVYGTNANWAPRVAADKEGNVFVATCSDSDRDEFRTVAYSSAGTPLWTNRYNQSHFDGDRVVFASFVAADTKGHVFVLVGGNFRLDYTLICYTSAGEVLWTSQYSPDDGWSIMPVGMVLDPSGNVFVTGKSMMSVPGVSADFLYRTVEYSAAGVPLWTNSYHGPGGQGINVPTGIAVDKDGNVFVTGRTEAADNYSPLSSLKYATVAYSNAGVPLWTNLFENPLFDSPAGLGANPVGVAVNDQGQVFVTGSAVRGTDGSYVRYAWATIAYSTAGTPLWTNYYSGALSAWASAAAVSPNGDVIVTGTSVDDKSGTDNLVTLAYSNTGAPLWTNVHYSSTDGWIDVAGGILVDRNGNVFVSAKNSQNRAALFAYSSVGKLLWSDQYSGSRSSNGTWATPSGLTLDNQGNVIVCGVATLQGSASGVGLFAIEYSGVALPPHLEFQRSGNRLVLNWTNAGFHLQSAPAGSGPFTNVPSAVRPFTWPFTGPSQFFRLQSD